MPAERYYVSQSMASSHLVAIENKELHHLLHVMRAAVGDGIEIINGEGALAEGILEKIEKQKAYVRIGKVILEERPSIKIVLAQAIPRINRLDFILEKGTELGMTELWLFPGRHSERQKLTEQQLNHMESVCVSAMKQCGRLFLPKIMMKPVLKDWTLLTLEGYYGDVDKEAPLFKDVSNNFVEKQGVVFFVGPESGFHEDEEAILRKIGAKGVKLHSNILRTDTAAIAALTLITHDL